MVEQSTQKTSHRRKAVVLFGPTAAGKTAASIHIANAFKGEVINADSRQIYQQMPIITAMPTDEERAAAPHHMFDFLAPDQTFSVGQWLNMAREKAEEIWAKGGLPIFVGGTGFYLKTLMDGISPMPETDTKLQMALEAQADEKGLDFMYAELQKIDPTWAAKVEANDRQRILRGHLAYLQTGKPLSEWHKLPPEGALDCDFVCLAISPPREVLIERINNRFLKMIEEGVVEEAKLLYDKYMKNGDRENVAPSLKSIGLPVYAEYFEGYTFLDDAHETVAQQMRQYAKRQRTWLRNSYPQDALVFEDGSKTDEIVQSVSNRLQSV
tara:strand:+ start:112954 stop:113928 length:975 start_codon:yes stop_codon:yes gene_type:complete